MARALEMLSDLFQSQFERALRSFKKRDWIPRLQKGDGNAAPHCSRADHGDRCNVTWSVRTGNARNLVAFTLRKEQVSARARLRGVEQFSETCLLLCQPLGQRQFARGLDGHQASFRGNKVFGPVRYLVSETREETLRIRVCDGHIRATAFRIALLADTGGKTQNMRAKILVVLKKRVDQPARRGIFALHRITRQDHLRCRFQPGNPG